MAQAIQKITLSASRDIPFNKLMLSQSNVRRIKAGVSIEELAEDIARRTLLQSLTVRPVHDADGNETGMFEIPAGGRRYRALELLVKQKRLAKTAPIPCVIREGGIAEEDSLAENVQRAPLHPLDQFRAFLALREKGQSEEEIAAAFFVAVSVVQAAAASGVGLAAAARRLCRGRHDAGPADGVHRQRRSRAPGAGVRSGFSRPTTSEPHVDPPHADGRRGPRGRQARAVRRARCLCRCRRRRHARPVPGRRWRVAAGHRSCSTGWSPRSSTADGEAIRAEGWKMGRGRARIRLRPHLRPAPNSRRAGATHRRRSKRRATRCRRRWTVWKRPTPDADELPEEIDRRLARDRDGVRRDGRAADAFRCRGYGARRRVRQHRRVGQSPRRARLCPTRGRGASRAGARAGRPIRTTTSEPRGPRRHGRRYRNGRARARRSRGR